MFESVNEAIAFADNKQDGGIPFFRYDAVEIKDSDPPNFEDVVMVEIRLKGDTKTVIDRPKRPEDEKRWPKQWAAFLAGTDAPLEGTPLKEFPALSPADIATCHRFNIRTVEDLSEMADVQLHNLGGRGVSLKQKAVKFLQYRHGPDIDDLQKQIKKLEKLVGDNISNVSERAAGDGVSKPKHTVRKQQPSRKNNKADSKNSGKKTS